MNVFVLSSVIAAVFCIILSIIVIIKSRYPLSISFAKVCLLIGFWTSFPFIAALVKSDEEALIYTRLIYFAASFVPYSFFRFMFIILGIDKAKNIKRFAKLSLVFATLFFISCYSPFFIKGIIRNRPYFAVIPGPLYLIFSLYFVISYCYVTPKLLKTYAVSRGHKRNQLKYIIFAFFLAFMAGTIHFLSAYGVPEIFPHDILVMAFSLIFTYAILRYRLLDITMAFTRTGVFVIVYTFVLGIPFALAVGLRPWLSAIIGLNWWMVPLGAMMALATIGPFLYIYLERRAEEKLFKEQKRYQNTLKQASLGMTRIRDLQKLLKLIVYMMTKSVRLNYASIYLLDKENNFFKMEAVRDVNKNRSRTILPQIGISSPLTRFLSIEREPLVLEEVGRRLQDNSSLSLLDEVRKQMFSLGASVIVPSFVEDKLLGFMALGDKRSGEIYTEDDLRVFTVLANQAALAIENARFFEEAKEMQDQISQAEKMATIGTMADGLSHQINNRFHALSLIAGDTMDTIKFTDVNNYTEEQKDLITQISHALERIQANVIQGGEIVKGMLKYTRKGEEGLASVTLNSIVDSALEMVQFKIRLSEIDIIKDYPKDTPPVHGNLTQLQEVFFNLIDNAYYAMMERREALKEEGYRGKIRIHTASLRSGYLSINIEDNGIGVKQENIKKMFTPFFTTKASSRKGTGLGLYVIKKLITGHNGKISIESTYGQGTKFIIDLPLARERVESKRVKS